MAQQIEIQADWENGNFHCPACGKLIFSDAGFPKESCNHVAFVWVDEVKEYFHAAPEVRELLRNCVNVEDECCPNLTEGDCGGVYSDISPSEDRFLNGLSKTTVVFNVKYGGVVCGPVSTTFAVGIVFDGTSRTKDNLIFLKERSHLIGKSVTS